MQAAVGEFGADTRRQFRGADGGGPVGAGGRRSASRVNIGAALQRQVEPARRARRRRHLDGPRPHHRQDRAEGRDRPVSRRSSTPMPTPASLPATSWCSTTLVVDQTAKTVTAHAHVDVDLFFPLFGDGRPQRVGDAIGRALFRQDDRSRDDARRHRLDGRAEDQGSEDRRRQCASTPSSRTRTRASRACASRSCPMPTRSTPARLRQQRLSSRPSSRPARAAGASTIRWPRRARRQRLRQLRDRAQGHASNSPTPAR